VGPFGPALALACRILLAAMLTIAAVAKIVDRRALPANLRAMGVAPPWFSVVLAVALPVVELAVAITLVVARHSALPALVTLALLIAFSGFLLTTVRRAVPCACFGSARVGRVAEAPAAIMRNGVLVGLAVLATASADGARAGATLVVGALVAASAVLVVRRVA
jgi:Methylamine utilisation protein MauE